MTALFAIAIFFCALLTGCSHESQAAATGGTDTVLASSPDFLQYLMDSFNGLEGASVFASSAVAIQVLLRVLDNPVVAEFFKRKKISRLTLIAALTFMITPIGLMNGAGLTLGAALVHSSTLMAFIAFLNQAVAEYQLAMESRSK